MRVTSNIAASIMTCSSLTSSLAITCLRAAISFFHLLRGWSWNVHQREWWFLPGETVPGCQCLLERVLLLRSVIALYFDCYCYFVSWCCCESNYFRDCWWMCENYWCCLDDPPLLLVNSSSGQFFCIGVFEINNFKDCFGLYNDVENFNYFFKEGKFSAWENMIIILVRSSASTLTSP